MSDKIARVTPREIAEMIWTEQAYAATRFVLADAHDAEIERLRVRVEYLEREMRFIGRLDYPPTRLSAQNRARAALTALRKLKS
jgi:hypothetical protein